MHPDYGGSRIEAFLADGTPLPAVYFDGDNRLGVTTKSTKTVTDSRGIAKIVLISADNDYVVFQGVTGMTFCPSTRLRQPPRAPCRKWGVWSPVPRGPKALALFCRAARNLGSVAS